MPYIIQIDNEEYDISNYIEDIEYSYEACDTYWKRLISIKLSQYIPEDICLTLLGCILYNTNEHGNDSHAEIIEIEEF